MFTRHRLRAVPSLSTAVVIVAATLTAGCGATDSPTAPETITGSGPVASTEAAAELSPEGKAPNRIDVDILPFIFDDAHVSAIGESGRGVVRGGVRCEPNLCIRVRLRATAVVAMDCPNCLPEEEMVVGDAAQMQQQFNLVLSFFPQNESYVITGQSRLRIETNTGRELIFRLRATGTVTCVVHACNANYELFGRAPGGATLSGAVSWTFILNASDLTNVMIASIVLRSASGWNIEAWHLGGDEKF